MGREADVRNDSGVIAPRALVRSLRNVGHTMQLLEDHSGRTLTSLDFGVAAERGPSSSRLPSDNPTNILIDASTLDEADVLAAARRERMTPQAVFGRLVGAARQKVSATADRLFRWFDLRVRRRFSKRVPTPIERAESAQTFVREPPPRLRSSQWDVKTDVIRERSFKGLSVHDLELDD